ncbi:MAG: hypothetical protein J6Z27_02585 [Bacteroidales bacterium]|nr:hypothetical protein [Bacteroidales bacterium]
MKKTLLLSILFSVCCLSVLPSCVREKETPWRDTSNGVLQIKAPAYSLRNQLIKIEATGINWPLDPTYTWTIGLISNDTLVGNPIIARLPDTTGSISIYLKIVKDGFFDTNGYGSTVALDTSAANNSLTGRVYTADTYVDQIDHYLYHTTKVGNLEWFADNLAWDGVGKAFKDAEATKYFFGRLYTWDEATGGESASGLGNGPQGACPPGWSVPTAEDWEDFGMAVNGGEQVSFLDNWEGLGEKVTVEAMYFNEKMWPYSPDHNHGNMFNWNAIPAGYSFIDNYITKGFKDYALWWSSTEKDEDLAYFRSIYSQIPDFNVSYTDKTDFRVSVRCVRKIN